MKPILCSYLTLDEFQEHERSMLVCYTHLGKMFKLEVEDKEC